MTDRPMTETVPFDPPPTPTGTNIPQPASGVAPGATNPLGPEETRRRIQELQEEIATLERDAAYVPYPKMLFKPPEQPIPAPKVDTRVVQSAEEEETATGEGWTDSLEEAQEATRAAQAEAVAALGIAPAPQPTPPAPEAPAVQRDDRRNSRDPRGPEAPRLR